jgi:hypothetical protein
MGDPVIILHIKDAAVIREMIANNVGNEGMIANNVGNIHGDEFKLTN